ncbi:MAG: peptidylprolyl isomerase [Betaproteobacteria bacterium]|nr:peptidylprolyl isomerase [Betaproteobacteria bacterium]
MTTSRPFNLLLAALLAGSVILPGAAHAQASAAKVNGTPIPQYRLDAAVKSRVAQGQTDSPELRKGIREALINQEIVAQEAVKKGLHKTPEIAARIELDRQTTLAEAYFQDYFKAHPVTDEMLRKEYDRIKPQLPGKEYRARHILVEKEDEAKSIIEQIKKGASFEKLAAEKSKDTGSKDKGGELNWSPATNYVKPFAEALATLKKNQMTDTPVQTDFGWHVIRLEDERATKLPEFETVKQQLQQMVQQQVVQKQLTDLRAKAKIE